MHFIKNFEDVAYDVDNLTGILDKPTDWYGEAPNKSDKFEDFQDPIWSVRATFIILYNYIHKHGLEKISQLISRWRFGKNNPQDLQDDEKKELHKYLNFVKKVIAKHDGGDDPKDLNTLFSIVEAIIMWESGDIVTKDIQNLNEYVVKAFEKETKSEDSPPAYKKWGVDINGEDYKQTKAKFLNKETSAQEEPKKEKQPKKSGENIGNLDPFILGAN